MQKTSPIDLADERENTETEIHVSGSETASHLPENRTAEQARQGHTGDHLRYILGFSFVGIVIAFAIAYLIFAT